MARIHAPPPLAPIIESLPATGDQSLSALIGQARPVDDRARYLHWDQLRHRPPPVGQTQQTWWLGMRLARQASSRLLPFTSSDGQAFTFSNVDLVQASVHRIDRWASGQRLAQQYQLFLDSSDRYLVDSLREEAIASSLFEGANSTRRVAKEMLRVGRPPHGPGERMILNNFRAMEAVANLAASGADLTREDILNLHQTVTTDTLRDQRDVGRFRGPGDDDVVVVDSDQRVVHHPPPAADLERRIALLVEFANAQDDSAEGFVHPVVRAILIHFMIGYDHPFVDGNGRTARALFYWSMLRAGYWLAPYLTISTILRRSRAPYERAYQYVKTDANDVTYFVFNQLEVIESALHDFEAYLRRQMAEVRELELRLQDSDLNHRQIALLRHAVRDRHAEFTIDAQRRQDRIGYATARADLLDLEARGLLIHRRSGKKFVFRPAPDLAERLGGAVQ